MLSPKKSRHLIEEAPVTRYDAVRPFGNRCYSRQAPIRPEHSVLARRIGETLKDGVSSTISFAAGHEELDGALKVFARNLREALGYFLKWRVFDLVSGKGPPTGNPEPAKTAVAIVNQERLDEFTLSHRCLTVPNWEAGNNILL